jgi:hypothetical protein
LKFIRIDELTPIIPATQEGEIRRIIVSGQPEQKVRETSQQQQKKPGYNGVLLS